MARRVAELVKYHGKWAVYLLDAHTYEYIGLGKKKCQETVDWLNNPKNQ